MPVLVPRRGIDFLGNKVTYDYSPPILGLPELPIHHIVGQVERVLKAYNIHLPTYYSTYGKQNASSKARNRYRKYYSYEHQQNIYRARKRRFESRLYSKSYKRKGWQYRHRYYDTTRRMYGYSGFSG